MSLPPAWNSLVTSSQRDAVRLPLMFLNCQSTRLALTNTFRRHSSFDAAEDAFQIAGGNTRAQVKARFRQHGVA